MSKIIKLRKGLDIKLAGRPERTASKQGVAGSYAVMPADFVGVVPKLLVQEGERVKAGDALFFDKSRPEILFTSPVSGKVAAVERGDKRKIMRIVIDADPEQEYVGFPIPDLKDATKEAVADVLLRSGMWAAILQRPYGIIATPGDEPKSIFISGFDSAPLAPDMNYALEGELDNLNKGVEVLKKLTGKEVHLGVRAKTQGVVNHIEGVQRHVFQGPHPSGNVGVQISHVDPVNKGDIVWTVDIQNLAVIGRLFNTGRLDMTKVYAVAGSEVVKPAYITAVSGSCMTSLVGRDNIKPQKDGGTVRVISGNVLTGTTVGEDGYIGFYANQVSVIPEGDRFELLGWAMPRLDKYSVSRTYFSWLRPGKNYVIDTNLHGGHRPFIMTGLFERYVPMDIYPMYLLKAILAGDIDKMENLGIYEVVEEDLALCEFVDPSKNDIQQMVRDGINLMIKELS